MRASKDAYPSLRTDYGDAAIQDHRARRREAYRLA